MEQSQLNIHSGPHRARGCGALMETVGSGSKLVKAGNQLKWITEALKKVDGVRVHVVHPHEVQWTTKSCGKTDRVGMRRSSRSSPGRGCCCERGMLRRHRCGSYGSW